MHSHGLKVPIIGLGLVNWNSHKDECYKRRLTYQQHQEANPCDSGIIKSYFQLYTAGEDRKYFHENDLKVFIMPARPHHDEALPTARAFEFEKRDGTRKHFCLEAGSTRCRVTRASNLSLFGE